VVILAVISVLVLSPLSATYVAASPYPQEAGPIVRCNPKSAYAGIGTAVPDVHLDMYVENVVGLYGVDLRISSFDTTIAQVVDQAPAAGVQIAPLTTFLQPDFVVRNSADNTAGTMRFAATEVAPSAPADGSGPVARITFHGLHAGTFIMTWGTVELSDVNGGVIPATAEPCQVTFWDPTSVTIGRFEALPEGKNIHMQWETVQEADILGFNLYRSTAPDGRRAKLNKGLIPTKAPPGSSPGAAYDWIDKNKLRPAHTYLYWLEDVDIRGHGRHAQAGEGWVNVSNPSRTYPQPLPMKEGGPPLL
jgi:hypothetical protein